MSDERGIISTYASGVDLVVEWKIEHFFTLPERDGAGYCSPDFSFSGERWWLRIYPNGASISNSSGHVDLELCKYPSNRSIKQSLSLSLKTVKGEKCNEEHCIKEFGKTFMGIYHVLSRFISRSELTRRRSELVPEGTLTVICTMKSSISAGRDRNEVPTAEVNTSGVAGSAKSAASGSSQVGTTTTKESVLKWIKENCNEALKGKKRKLEEEIVLKWIEENCKQTSEGKKRKLEEKNASGSLCEDYKKVLLLGRHHDLILKVGDKELRAHRDILRARSKVFESMMDHDMKEKNTGIIDVPDCDPNAMELFLSYVYCGKIEELDHNNILGLYYVTDKYEMVELKREGCNFIKKSLSLTNICSVIQLTLKHSDSDLLEYATGYFSDNMLDIMQTVEWQSFLKDNSTVGNELLMKSIKKLKNAQT